MTEVRMFTVSRADGENVGDEYSHFVTHRIDDWSDAETEMSCYDPADYEDDDQEIEWVIEEWVLVAANHRKIPRGKPT